MKVVVLGATGFVGRHLVSALQKQHIKPYVLVRSTSSRIAGCINIVGDALTGAGLSRLCKEADVVINLIGRFEQPFDLQVGLNVTATRNICAALDPHTIKQFIHVSAAAIYGSVTPMPKELSEVLPDTDYGLSKKMGEEVVQDYHRRFHVPYIILRPTNIYGPRATSGVVRSMIASLQKNSLITINGNGTHMRDFLYVSDFIDALLKIMDKGVKHKVYNISSGDILTLKELATLLVNKSSKKIRIQYNTKVNDPMVRIIADSSRVRRDISWRSNHTLKTAVGGLVGV